MEMCKKPINGEDYAPITQALREYIERHPTMMHAVGLTDLCDNIDAIHKSLEDEYADMRTFVDRLSDAADKREDVDLWDTNYTALPLDADGVPIHIGDVMEWCDSGEKLTVEGIGSDVLFYIEGENAEWTAARNKRHHHEPTVEDVLAEFAAKLIERGELTNGAAQTIAEYAAKLRLAGDAE